MAEEGLNRVILIGRLGQDPELKFTQSNMAVLNVRMATTEIFFDQNKEKKERTEWHSVTIWGKRGEALNKILEKGSRVCIEGRLETRSWEDKKSGEKRYATGIVATNVLLLGGKGEGAARGGGGGGHGHGHAPPPGGDEWGDGQGPAGDDDIPF